MHFTRVPDHEKASYRTLLLQADEQWDIVEEYLAQGEMWVAVERGAVLGECVVTTEPGVVEVRNLSVTPEHQREGVGRALIGHVRRTYAAPGVTLRIRTGDSPLTVPFYEACGLRTVGREAGYFTRCYDHPIYEAGKLLTDMVIMEQDLSPFAPA